MQEIKRAGYWIINCNAIVRCVIFNCIRCWSILGKFGEQIMADLPKDHVNEAPPFTYCGVDLFGPLLVKETRSKLKRYGALCTCLVSRAVHIEVVATMETFIYSGTLKNDCQKRQYWKHEKWQWYQFCGDREWTQKGISRNEPHQN